MSSCRNPVEEVVVDFTYETESPDGDKTIHAYSLDGRVILITKPNPAKLARLKQAESDEKKQEDYSEWLRRGGNRARKHEVYIPGKFWKFCVTINSVKHELKQK
ncbi:MAG TPA: hypothetical protein VFE91_03850 [Nitrososphaerales archaeon]|nr:hypothetical protein [Nitrososphaerales archaeon]